MDSKRVVFLRLPPDLVDLLACERASSAPRIPSLNALAETLLREALAARDKRANAQQAKP